MARGSQRANRVPLYSKLAGSCFQSHNLIRSVDWIEAARLRDEKQVRVFCRHCGKESQTATCRNQGGHQFIGQFREKLREEMSKPGTITLGEIYANAGLFGASHTAHMSDEQRRKQESELRDPEDFIERAQTKILLWKQVGDDRAPQAY